MPKYRKKPVVIEAVLCNDIIKAVQTDWEHLPKWVKDAYENGGWIFFDNHIIIPTLEGNMKASRFDMIIKGVDGEFYPCKPDIFEKTYEKLGIHR